jgi:outer membrane protein assembly factor BamA
LGAQYRIAEVTWEGAKAFYPEDLGKAMMLKAGAVADAMQLDEDLRKVLTFYGSKGFVRASANATPVFDDQQKAVSYMIHVREGAVYRFRSVELQGIDKASAARLREEWKLREGEPFDAGYPREYARAIGRLLPPNVSIEPRLEIDDESQAVDYTVRFIQHADKVIREKK